MVSPENRQHCKTNSSYIAQFHHAHPSLGNNYPSVNSEIVQWTSSINKHRHCPWILHPNWSTHWKFRFQKNKLFHFLRLPLG